MHHRLKSTKKHPWDLISWRVKEDMTCAMPKVKK